jgi:hypothetical protein
MYFNFKTIKKNDELKISAKFFQFLWIKFKNFVLSFVVGEIPSKNNLICLIFLKYD